MGTAPGTHNAPDAPVLQHKLSSWLSCPGRSLCDRAHEGQLRRPRWHSHGTTCSAGSARAQGTEESRRLLNPPRNHAAKRSRVQDGESIGKSREVGSEGPHIDTLLRGERQARACEENCLGGEPLLYMPRLLRLLSRQQPRQSTAHLNLFHASHVCPLAVAEDEYLRVRSLLRDLP